MSMQPAISASELTKVYRVTRSKPGIMGALRSLVAPAFSSITAADQLTFSIQTGETVGYIGLNGAGKSTTIKMLTGILVPTSGSVRVLGMEPHRQRMALTRRLGVVFGQRTQLWWDLPVRESFHLLRMIYEVSPDDYRRNMSLFHEYLNLNDLWDRPVRSLSLGQRMRAELAAACVHNPELFILDEPTIGLDVLAKERIRAFLKELNSRHRTTIILTTHDLRDVEEVCDKLLLIDGGKIRYQGTREQLHTTYGTTSFLTVDLEYPCDCTPLPGLEVVSQSEHRYVFGYDRLKHKASELVSALTHQYPVKHVTQRDSNLEDIIHRMYRGREVSA